MSENTSINWQENFLGVAYRFFDVRMNIALMFPERKEASNLWLETVHWWNDHTIKVRFVEIGDEYWFIAGADSRKPSTNKSFYKILPKSENYERFKKGHNGSAILRFAVYTKKFYDGVKNDVPCDCGHRKDDHNFEKNDSHFIAATIRKVYFAKNQRKFDRKFPTCDFEIPGNFGLLIVQHF